jgi:RimJ/RimL family protein N-acetyltransferase
MSDKKIILETERLVLREYCQEDFPWLSDILTDAETMKYYEKPYDARGVQRWLDWSLENYEKYGFGLWVIELRETGEPIGDAGITMQPIDGEWLPEIGYHINKNFWRLGYASEAASAVRDWAFRNRDFSALYSYMTVENVPSQATAAACGLKKIKEYEDKDGENLAVYKITRDEWLKI